MLKKTAQGAWHNHQTLQNTDAETGCAAAIDGRVAVVGSCNNTTATIYHLQDNGQWQVEAVLNAPQDRNRHGYAVAVAGDTIAISSPSPYPAIVGPNAPIGYVDIYRRMGRSTVLPC